MTGLRICTPSGTFPHGNGLWLSGVLVALLAIGGCGGEEIAQPDGERSPATRGAGSTAPAVDTVFDERTGHTLSVLEPVGEEERDALRGAAERDAHVAVEAVRDALDEPFVGEGAPLSESARPAGRFRHLLQRGAPVSMALEAVADYRDALLSGEAMLQPGDMIGGVNEAEDGSFLGVYGFSSDGSDWVDVGGQPWEYGLFEYYDGTPPGTPLLESFVADKFDAQARFAWFGMDFDVSLGEEGVHWSLREDGDLLGTIRYGHDMEVVQVREGGETVTHLPMHLPTWDERQAALVSAPAPGLTQRWLLDADRVAFEHELAARPPSDLLRYEVHEVLEFDENLALRIEGEELDVGEMAETVLPIVVWDNLRNRPARMEIAPPLAWDAIGRTTEHLRESRDALAPIWYRVEHLKPGYYRLALVIEAEWLLDDARVYPVVLDPTLQTTTGDGATHGYWHEPFNQYWRWSNTQYYLTASQMSVVPTGSVIAGTAWNNRTNFDYADWRQFTRDGGFGYRRSGGSVNGFPSGTITWHATGPMYWGPGPGGDFEDRSGHYENFVEDADAIFTPEPDSCLQNCGRVRPGQPGQGPCSCRADCAEDPSMDCCPDVGVCGGGQLSCFGACGGSAPGGCRCDEACLTDGGFVAGDCCADIGLCFTADEQEEIYDPPGVEEWSCVGHCGTQDRSSTTSPATYTFDNLTLNGSQCITMYDFGDLSGTWTTVSVDATLNSSSGGTWASDLMVIVNFDDGFLDYQFGGSSNYGAYFQRFFWPSSANTTAIGHTFSATRGPVSNPSAASRNWFRLCNGWASGGLSSWSGTVTIGGASVTQSCSCDSGCTARGDCCSGSASQPVDPSGAHYQLACAPPDGNSCENICGDNVDGTVCVPNGTFSCSSGQYMNCSCTNCGGTWPNGQQQPPCCASSTTTQQVCTTTGAAGYCPNDACRDAICDADAFCCNNSWDGLCASAAESNSACTETVTTCAPQGGNASTGFCNEQPTENCTNQQQTVCSCSHNCVVDGNCCDNKDFYCGESNLAGTLSCLGYCGGMTPGGCSCAPDCDIAGNCCPDVEFYCTAGDTCVGRCDEYTTSQAFSCRSDCGNAGQPPCAPDSCQICGVNCAQPGDDVYEVRSGWFGGLTGGTGNFAGDPLSDIRQNLDGSGALDFFYRQTESFFLNVGQFSPNATGGPRPEFQFTFCPSGGSTRCEIYRFANSPSTTGLSWPSHPRTRLRYFAPTALLPNTNTAATVTPGIESVRMHSFETGTSVWNGACRRELVLTGSSADCGRVRVTLYNSSLNQIAQLDGCGIIDLDTISGLTATTYVRVDQPDGRTFEGNVNYSLRLALDAGEITVPPLSAGADSPTAITYSWTADPSLSHSFQILPGSVGSAAGNWTGAPSASGAVSPRAETSLTQNTCYTGRLTTAGACGDGISQAQTSTFAPVPTDSDFEVTGSTVTFNANALPGLGDSETCNGVANTSAIEVSLVNADSSLTPATPVPGEPRSFTLPPFDGCGTIAVRYVNRLGVINEGGYQFFEIEGTPQAPSFVQVVAGSVGTGSITWRWPATGCTTGYDFGNSPDPGSLVVTDYSSGSGTQTFEQTGLDVNTCYDGYVRSRNAADTSDFVSTSTGTPTFGPAATLMTNPSASSLSISASSDYQQLEIAVTDTFPNLGSSGTCGTQPNQSAVRWQARPCERERVAVLNGFLSAPSVQPASGWEEAAQDTFSVPSLGHHCWEFRVQYRNLTGSLTDTSPWIEWRGWDLTPPTAPESLSAGVDRITWGFDDRSRSEDYFQLRTRLCSTFGACASAPNPNPSAWSDATTQQVNSEDVIGLQSDLSVEEVTGTSGVRLYGNVAYQSALRAVLHHSVGASPPQGQTILGDWSESSIAFTRAAPPSVCGTFGGDAGFCDNWRVSRDLVMTGLRCEPTDPQGEPWQSCAVDFRIGGLGAFSPDETDQNISNNRCTRQAGASLVRERVEIDADGNVIEVLGSPVALVVNECLDPANEALCNENQCGSQNPNSAYPGRYGFGVSGEPYWEARHEGRVSDEGLVYGETYRYTMRYYNSDGLPSEPTSVLFTVGCSFGDEGVCAEGVQLPAPYETGQPVVDINSASVSELETLPGIGESRAQSIVDHRSANGPFATPEGLMDVSGIGESVFLGLCDRVVASGVPSSTQDCGRTIVSASACMYPGYDGFERCNGVDWSCSGDPTTEFGQTTPISEECYEGPGGTVGIGTCAEGERFCIETPEGSGEYAYAGECVGQVLPEEEETCDGLDSTCSGDPFDVDFGDDFCGGFVSTFPEGTTPVTAVVHSSVILSADGGRVETESGSGTFVCANGVPICDEAGIGCEDFFINECGGCEELTNASGEPVVLGEPCGSCSDEVWECDGEGGARCSDSGIGGEDCEIDGALGLCAQGETVCGPDGVTCEPTYEYDPSQPADFCDMDDLDCDGDPFNDARIASIEITGVASGGVGTLPGFASSAAELTNPGFELDFEVERDCDMYDSEGACSVVEFLIENEGNDVIPAGSLVSLERMDVSRPVTGLLGEYFSGREFGSLVFERIDESIDFDWGSGSPGQGLPENNFSVRWRGNLTAPGTGEYTFYARTDDGARLVIDGLPVITNWVQQGPTTVSGSITLQEGQAVPFAFFYFEQVGNASARLEWEGPGISGRQVVPRSAFSPYEGSQVSPRLVLPRDVPPQFTDTFTFCWESAESAFGTTLRVVVEDPQSEQNEGMACIGPWRPESLVGSEPEAGVDLVVCGPEICDGYDNNLNGEVNEMPEACGDISLDCLAVESASCGPANGFACPQPNMNCNADLGYCFVCAGTVKEE